MALFFYVGAEVVAGDTIIRYGISLGIPIATAKAFTTYTLISMIVGYILGIIVIPKVISQRKALIVSAILGLVLTACAMAFNGTTSVFCVAILGFANAIVWPAIWPLAIHNLGKFIKTGSAMLIMAIAGGAVLPVLWGKMSDIFNPHFAYIILFPCYLIILLYASWWCKLRTWKYTK